MTAQGYTRQSAGSIVTGAVILASGLNAEFNQLVAAFDGTTGHDHSGLTGEGATIDVAALTGLTSTSSGIIAANGANGYNIATITGTSGTITVTNGSGASGNPTITIDSTYLGQSSITTLGTITTGVWTGTAVAVLNGGTGATTASGARTNLGLGTLATQSGTFSGTSSGTNTGDQTITLTGGVTGSGTGSFAATVVTNANLTGVITSSGNTTSIASQTGTGSKFVVDTSPAINTPAISGGTINNNIIGGTTPAAITGTVITGNSFIPNSSTVPSHGVYFPGYGVGLSHGSQPIIVGVNNSSSDTNLEVFTNSSSFIELFATGTAANIELQFGSSGTKPLSFFTDANSTFVQQFAITHTASAVNNFSVTGDSGASPTLSVVGSSANINCKYQSKGSSGHYFYTGAGLQAVVFDSGGTAVNYFNLQGNTTGNSPNISAQGSDSNITLQLFGKGTGGVAIAGTSTNDNAAAGYVGEVIESEIASGSAVSMTSTTAANITSITLTKGDWDIRAQLTCAIAAGTTITRVDGSISTTTGTQATAPNGGAFVRWVGSSVGVSPAFLVGEKRVSIASSTTYYLVATPTFSSSTCSIYGYLGARRVR